MGEVQEYSNIALEIFKSENINEIDWKKLEDILHDAIKCDPSKKENVEKYYCFISSMIDYIRQITDHFERNISESVIFLIGATGSGKSTLVNYLLYPQNLIVSKRRKLQIEGRKTSVKIGTGSGSTTLIPNVQESDLGTFLDCAGEEDTRGILAEVINSILKIKISFKVKHIKILFIAPQTSLGCEGSYGACFKNALDKSAQFFQNIEYFKNSIGLVISHADVENDALEISENLIKTILKEHSNLNAYKNSISHVVLSKNVAIFSKPAHDVEVGDHYSPPSWNPNQREIIIEMIQKLPFTPVQQNDFFHISTSANVREVMSKSRKIVEMKTIFLLKDLVEKASPFTIYGVELKPFVKYLSVLMHGFITTLPKFIKFLSWNNYFKIQPNENLVKKLNEEIIFLSQFTSHVGKISIEQDWIKTADLIGFFTTTYSNVYAVASSPGNNFMKFGTYGNVTVKPTSPHAHNILKHFKELKAIYEKKKEIDLMGKDQNSLYFESKTMQVFSHFKDVAYKEKIQYEATELYETLEDYIDNEKSLEKQEKFRPVIKKKLKNYTEMTPKTVVKEEVCEETSEKKSNIVKKVFDVVYEILTNKEPEDTSNKTKVTKVPVTEYVPTEKTRKEYHKDFERYEEVVEVIKPVKKTRTVMKSRPVIKEKEVEKTRQEPVYKQELIKQFNSTKFHEDIERMDNKITKECQLIRESINMYPKAQILGDHHKDSIVPIDDFDKNHEHLLNAWQNAEYEAYFAQNPNNSLSEVFHI